MPFLKCICLYTNVGYLSFAYTFSAQMICSDGAGNLWNWNMWQKAHVKKHSEINLKTGTKARDDDMSVSILQKHESVGGL